MAGNDQFNVTVREVSWQEPVPMTVPMTVPDVVEVTATPEISGDVVISVPTAAIETVAHMGEAK